MARKRGSKRRRMNQDERKEEEEEEQTTGGGVDEGSEKSVEKSEKCPVVVFAHGAGAPSSSDFMVRWKGMLAKALNAVEMVTFDYPYIAGGKRRAPPKAEKLVDFHRDVVQKTLAKYPGHPLILAGKSMGSRVSCMVAGEKDITVSAVVCLGYPLKGSKDGLCPLAKLEAVRKKMNSINALHVIEGGDHSFKIGKKHLQSSGNNQEEAEDIAVQAIAKFVSNIMKER
ncbi:KAT8 regulatory NSL complex subunit 3 isoform X3 [Sesamum indicum]|uniref:KAT8 regulatory NSL complex subunit 3 isoform X3 n=1 Tax=Sesamum indicum TaxID=4182 RepID=A0A8M8UL13_SESIN|nr:KAT8 regulatory NSL complex subunit 3 isoform X3 [Sesamum indicum]